MSFSFQAKLALGIRLIGLTDVVDTKQSQNHHTVANVAGVISIVNTSDTAWQPGDLLQWLPRTKTERETFFIPEENKELNPVLEPAAVNWRKHDLRHYPTFESDVCGLPFEDNGDYKAGSLAAILLNLPGVTDATDVEDKLGSSEYLIAYYRILRGIIDAAAIATLLVAPAPVGGVADPTPRWTQLNNLLGGLSADNNMRPAFFTNAIMPLLLGTREVSLTHDATIWGRVINYVAPGQEGTVSPLSVAAI